MESWIEPLLPTSGRGRRWRDHRQVINAILWKLRTGAPWLQSNERDPGGPASRVGVPTMPFPGWLRCTVCNLLAPLEGGAFGFENSNARQPQDAHFYHDTCPKKKTGKRPLAIPARFVLTCIGGHLDEFPWVSFTHRGGTCPDVAQPSLLMDDRGGNLGANVELQCRRCGAKRNIREAAGARGERNLPPCRGRHPHLGCFDPAGCTRDPKMLVIGASNQWFADTLAALAVPKTGASTDAPDLLTPEWQIFTEPGVPDSSSDFTLRRDRGGVPGALKEIFADVVHAERLREVRALVGFTRLDAPDPEEPGAVQRVRLARDAPTWVPASEVRGEGIFLRLPEDLLAEWEQRVKDSDALQAHREAYARFRANRYSDRQGQTFEPMKRWPGARYIALHTLSHLLIRTISLECGYSAASLSERLYPSQGDDPRAGILIYTAVPDAEGTLGGLVSLAEPEPLTRLVRRALSEARHCSSDPLCAERLPEPPADFVHGAACHVCLFVSETTCERGNRFLDRRFVVPIDADASLALYPDLP
ncbi:DrmB family protein [Cryptosporangium japonicum]|uniref:DrmB family protein n=1 Tax=Cryptosporangium japonicum TaxID=80872 RepID=UPI0031E13F07